MKIISRFFLFCKIALNSVLRYFHKVKYDYLKKSGIPLKISSLIIVISMFFLIVITVFQYINSNMEMKREISDTEKLLMARLRYEYIDSIWNYDKKSITNLMIAEMGNETILSIRISDDRGRTIGWFEKTGTDFLETKKEPVGQYLKKLTIPIFLSDKKIQSEIGHVDAWLDYRKIYEKFYTSLIIDITRMILVILSIVFTILILTVIKIARPLDVLRTKMIEAGNFILKNENIDINLKIPKNSFSELKEMDSELEGMINKINASSNELKGINVHLEDLVKIRTVELIKTNRNLLEVNGNLEAAYDELKNTQNQLINSEKMIILGNLVAGIAHELNTPLGAIISSNNMMKTMIDNLKTFLKNYGKLNEESKKIFHYLLNIVFNYDKKIIDFTEDRARRKQFLKVFQSLGIKNPEIYVEKLIDMGFDKPDGKLIEILNYPDILSIINDIYNISTFVKSYYIIKIASEKAAIVVNALKTYTYQNQDNKKIKADIVKDIEIILTLYHNKIKYGVEIIRKYEKIPKIEYYSEKLNNVWSNLISNALYAMDYKGVLEIYVENMEDFIVVSFIDNGPGILDNLKDKIFQPFFTTKRQGEGTGLGLDISRRILSEIGGRIEFESRPGRTRFSVYLKTNGEKA